MRKMVLSIAAVCAITLAQVCSFAGNLYDESIASVRTLSESPNVRLLTFGKSCLDRQIPAYIISDFTRPPDGKSRILIIAGQHGDEPSPVKSVLKLSEELAAGYKPELIANCVVIVVPMVNADGIASSHRFNARGIDLNRDWLALTSPETQFVHTVVKRWKPNVMIDTHEWTGPLPNHPDSVETPAFTPGTLADDLGSELAHASGLTRVYDSSSMNQSLFHRRYASLGYASYLLETAPGRPFISKYGAYRSAILTAAGFIVNNQADDSALSPASQKFDIAAVDAYLEPIRTESHAASATAMAAIMLGTYCFLIWALKPSRQTGETPWSRRFRKCLVDPELQTDPLLARHMPQPLTSRSWAHRRLRARYAVSDQS